MRKKKFFKIAGVILLVILGILIAIPFLLEGRIGTLLKNNVNNNINGTFDFEEANLSLIRSFPNASLTVRGMHIINNAPFEGDTLVKAGRISLSMGLGELFKGEGEPIAIRNLDIEQARLFVEVDEQERANYDIARETGPSQPEETATEGFSLDMQSYSLKDSDISYRDRSTGIEFLLEDIDHEGNGDLSLEKSELETKTHALVSLDMDGTNYLNRNSIELDAVFEIDLAQNRYTFLKNEALINQLPLVFEGYVQLHDEYQEVELKFKTPSSDFRNFLALIPETYTKSIEGVTTTGNFQVEGEIMGRVDETHIPQFNIILASEDASFKYPQLPRSVRDINIDAVVKNTTGIAEDTFVEINKASFAIDQDRFNLRAVIRELMGNTTVDAHLDGSMNLANLSEAYPIPADLNLKGQLNADINTAFDMESVERKNYENTRTNGFFNVRNFEYASPELAQPVAINSMTVEFNPKTVTLKEMGGTTGRTDFRLGGSINNLLGFLFNDEMVEGNFNLSSDTFVLNDFMVAKEEARDSSEPKDSSDSGAIAEDKQLKIPAFLDCTIQASANNVLYDNLTLKNVSGTLRIKDQTATLSNLTSSIFDGKLALSGTVSTKEELPTFSMQLGMEGFRIGETFKQMELFRTLAPVANALEGRLNSQIEIAGLLTDELTPDLASISGNALAQLIGTEINPENAPVLNTLSSKLDFLSARDFDLGNLKTALNFENGLVSIRPFTVNYKDIAINVDGGHGFDRTLNYKATLQVPAKYLGKEVNDLIAKINDDQLEGLTIPIAASIGGKYNNPVVTTDLSSGVRNLTAQLVEIQKQKLIARGKDEARDLIGGLLKGTSKDSLQPKDTTRTRVGDVVGGILKKPAPADTTVVNKDSAAVKKEPVREAAKEILGGLLNRKKQEQTKKDSIN